MLNDWKSAMKTPRDVELQHFEGQVMVRVEFHCFALFLGS